MVIAQPREPGGHLPGHMHACAHVLLPHLAASPTPRHVWGEAQASGTRAGRGLLGQGGLGGGEAHLHLEEGRPEGGPPADPLQEGCLGLLHRLISVLVAGQEDALGGGEGRAREGQSQGPSLTHPPLLCESLLNVLGVVLKPSGLAPPGFLLWPPWPAPRWVKVPLGAEGCGAEFQGEGGIRGCLQRAGPGEGG